MRRGLILTCVLSCGAFLASCGGSGSDSNDPGPRAVAVAWVHAMASGDGEKACALMTPASVRMLEDRLKRIPPMPLAPPGMRKAIPGDPSRPCPKVMAHGFGPHLPVASTSVTDGQAVVRLDDRDQIMHRIVLLSIHGRWRVDFARTWDHPFGTD